MTSNMMKTGVIGLGTMGMGAALSLVKAGLDAADTAADGDGPPPAPKA